MQLEGKVAIVTGGARGVAKGVATGCRGLPAALSSRAALRSGQCMARPACPLRWCSA